MSWGAELELERGGYSRVEHVERVENAELRQIRLRGVPANSADFLALEFTHFLTVNVHLTPINKG